MFDARAAFKKLDGKTLAFREFQKELERILFDHISQLPAHFDTRDLYKLAMKKNWISEQSGQMIKISIID